MSYRGFAAVCAVISGRHAGVGASVGADAPDSVGGAGPAGHLGTSEPSRRWSGRRSWATRRS